MSGVRVGAEPLRDFVAELFAAHDLPPEGAATVAEGLVRASLRGVDSHGVARVPMYLHRIREGAVAVAPEIRVEAVTPAVSLVDGGDGLGFVVGRAAMAEAIARAETMGVGLVGVRRSGHFGMSALYVQQALEAGMLSLVFTNSSPAMPVWGGRSRLLGASPFAAGAPGGEGVPVLIDMACTVTARGKLKYAAQRGEPIPEGLALDAEGRPTTDGEAAFHGVVLPFGGVKGAALSLLMEVLCGVLTGAAFGGEVGNPYTDTEGPQGVGHLFVALRPDLFLPPGAFEARLDALVARAKASPLAVGFDEILMPGEPEARTERERSERGIPLTPDVVEALRAEALRAGVGRALLG